MRDELSRSKKDLRLAQLELPYFISYQVREVEDAAISASRGSLLASGENRSRMLTVELRVGDYAVDNTNFFAGPEFAFTRNRSFFGFNELPLDDNYFEFRRVIWLATDSAYKQALENLAGKRAALQNRTRSENLPDFSKEEPTRTTDILPAGKFERSSAELLVRSLSKILGNVPDLYNSSVALSATYSRTVYLNSEGTSYEITEPLVTLAASASTQAVDGMPEGPIKAVAPKVVLPDREMMKTQMEALIYHFKIITEGFAVPEGEVYQAVESPRGEMGYYVVSDGTAKPYRVHMRAACLANLQLLPSMCEGRLLADVVAAIGSIDIVLGEIDR